MLEHEPAADLDESNVHAVVLEAFNMLGGIRALAAWGKRNQAAFYRLWLSSGPRARPGRPPGGRGGGNPHVRIPGFDDQES